MGGRLGEWVSERVGRCARVCVGGQGGVAGRQGRALQISSEFSLFDAWKEFTTAVPDAEVWPSLIPQPIPSSPTRTQPPTATVADRRRGFGIQASRARCLLSVHRLHMAQSFPDDLEVCTATLVRIAPGSSRVDCQELRCLYLICRFPPGQPSRAAAAAATQVDLPLYKISNISLVRPKEHAGADDPAEPNGDALEQLLISVEGGSTPELHRYFCRDSHGLATVIVRNLQKWLGKTLEVLEIETRAPAHRSARPPVQGCFDRSIVRVLEHARRGYTCSARGPSRWRSHGRRSMQPVQIDTVCRRRRGTSGAAGRAKRRGGVGHVRATVGRP